MWSYVLFGDLEILRSEILRSYFAIRTDSPNSNNLSCSVSNHVSYANLTQPKNLTSPTASRESDSQ